MSMYKKDGHYYLDDKEISREEYKERLLNSIERAINVVYERECRPYRVKFVREQKENVK